MRPQPVLLAAVLVLAGEIVGLLVAFGVEVSDTQRVAILGTVAAIGGVASIVGAWWASRRVTPLSSPRDVDGQPFVRLDVIASDDESTLGRRFPPDDR